MITSKQNLRRFLIFSRTSSLWFLAIPWTQTWNLVSRLFQQYSIQCPFSDITFNEADIMEAIDTMRSDASPGPDEIILCSVLLSNCKQSVAKPIYLIWSRSLKSGNVPPCYKSSIITPLHKKDSLTIVFNYRPVSLYPMSSRSVKEWTTCEFPRIKKPTLQPPVWISVWSQLSYSVTASFWWCAWKLP